MNTNILITSAGRRVSLVRFFRQELAQLFPGAKVFTTDANPSLSAACRVSDGSFSVRRVTAPGYLEELIELVRSQGIGLIVPTIDTELLLLAEHRETLFRHGARVLVPDLQLVQACRDKRLIHAFFSEHGIQTAREYAKDDYRLPLYIKPYDGSRSIDNYVITEQEQLTAYHFSNEKLMFLEYLDHRKHTEFTIDLYYRRDGSLACLVPRQRLEVREGEVNKAVTRDALFIPELWEKLSRLDGARGCVTLQVFVNMDTKQLYGIEINPRFGGGYPLSYLAGANFPNWAIREYLMDETIPVYTDWEKNLLMLRYDDEVLVHAFQG